MKYKHILFSDNSVNYTAYLHKKKSGNAENTSVLLCSSKVWQESVKTSQKQFFQNSRSERFRDLRIFRALDTVLV